MSILNSTAAILRLMSTLKRGVTVSDVVEHLQFPKSTASRLLKQLAQAGFLARDAASLAYQPGLMLLEVAHLVRRNSSLTDHIEQALRDLCRVTGHTGYLSVLDGHDVLVLRVIPGVHALRVIRNPGSRSPAWRTSTGRALLARLSPHQLDSQFRAAIPATVEHAMPFAQLSDNLAAVRQCRWASAVNEAVAGAASVSCAVSDPNSGETIAFCLTFPASMANESEIDHLARRLCAAATDIGTKVGDSYWFR
ncbi:IclR family transcriptional regulator [Sodalis sp. RH21]|uniref:IclR family transcriptional regulator n=1 Tax=unclassified Sodalis (in: enterobacteria) TaxID=2636512 RepID=UPI0039B5B0A3